MSIMNKCYDNHALYDKYVWWDVKGGRSNLNRSKFKNQYIQYKKKLEEKND